MLMVKIITITTCFMSFSLAALVCSDAKSDHCWEDTVDHIQSNDYEPTAWTNIDFAFASTDYTGTVTDLLDDDILSSMTLNPHSDGQSIQIYFPSEIEIGAVLFHTKESETTAGKIVFSADQYDASSGQWT